MVYLAGYGKNVGYEDDWYDTYAGKIYPRRADGRNGLEVPTKYIEWLTLPPEQMAILWRQTKFRDTMTLVLTLLF